MQIANQWKANRKSCLPVLITHEPLSCRTMRKEKHYIALQSGMAARAPLKAFHHLVFRLQSRHPVWSACAGWINLTPERAEICFYSGTPISTSRILLQPFRPRPHTIVSDLLIIIKWGAWGGPSPLFTPFSPEWQNAHTKRSRAHSWRENEKNRLARKGAIRFPWLVNRSAVKFEVHHASSALKPFLCWLWILWEGGGVAEMLVTIDTQGYVTRRYLLLKSSKGAAAHLKHNHNIKWAPAFRLKTSSGARRMQKGGKQV